MQAQMITTRIAYVNIWWEHWLQHVYTRGNDPNLLNVAIRVGSLPSAALRIHTTIRLDAKYFKPLWHNMYFAIAA